MKFLGPEREMGCGSSFEGNRKPGTFRFEGENNSPDIFLVLLIPTCRTTWFSKIRGWSKNTLLTIVQFGTGFARLVTDVLSEN